MSWTHAIFILGMNVNPRSLKSIRNDEPEKTDEGKNNSGKVVSIENVTRIKRKDKTPGKKGQLIPFRKGT